MKISVNTKTEEIAELRAAVAIIEDAIKRRENGEDLEEDYDSETQTTVNEISSYEEPEVSDYEEETEISNYEEQKLEEPKIQERKEVPSVDMSALSTSDYGERIEKRNMDSQPVQQQTVPPQNNKQVVRDIIQSLKDKNRGGPIQMMEIVRMARDKSISEDETRKLVHDLQRESSI